MAYFQNRYTQPISSQGGGASTIAAYHAINGLGCINGPPGTRAMRGFGADAPAAPAPTTWLTPGNVLAALAVGFGFWWTLGGGHHKTMKHNGRHRRNGRWSTRYKNSLPDSAFLYVAPGGRRHREGGKTVTVPRSQRHFPYKTRSGRVDLPHLRDAIGRIPQSRVSRSLKPKLQAKARRILASA